jgi:hypothetical protein
VTKETAMARRLVRLRTSKMQAQNGCCYYCDQQMWSENLAAFCRSHRITQGRAALFRCTAEHLVPRGTGGATTASNIVAACLHCNRTRHRAKRPKDPESYGRHVRARIARGGWVRLPAPG